MASTRRIYLHIGLHKTGTTFLQSACRANRQALLEQGVLYPGGPEQRGLGFATWDLMGRRPYGTGDPRISGAWNALVAHVHATDPPTILLSDEKLSSASVAAVRRAVGAFPDHEVHIVATVRDLARVLVSSWQERLKNRGGVWTWREFMDAVMDDSRRSQAPARHFWLNHDVAAILRRWEAGVPPDRIHVVTVPPVGSPPHVLMDRFASIVGFDPSSFVAPRHANETIGLAGTELVRRLNAKLGSLNQRQYDRVVKQVIGRHLVDEATRVRSVLPQEDLDWARARSAEMTRAIRSGGYHVVGDLADLEPLPTPGRRPDEATDGEVLDAAVSALSRLAEQHAKAWWEHKKPDPTPEDVSRRARAVSGLRGALFASLRAGSRVADRSKHLSILTSMALRAREARERRAVRRR